MSLQNNLIVKFKGHPELNIVLNDNHVARDWLKLFVKNYQKEFPIFRDQKKYTIEYLRELALQAKNNLNWDCETEFNNIQDTVTLHKCLEHTLQQGFATIPAEYDNLIHELHFCLHKIEYIDFANTNTNRYWLQIEWFNDDGFALDESFQHSLEMNFGDIRLQNPYVGHIPLQVYHQDDYNEIMQTCKFHDFVRPGLYICTHDIKNQQIDKNDYIKWWSEKAPTFVAKHGIDKILHYTGHPVIGRVTNLDDLETVVNSKDVLELEIVK